MTVSTDVHQQSHHGWETLTPSPSAFDNSDDTLRKTLAKLAHLDLTKYIQRDGTVMKAHGGYCDVFMGSIAILSPDSPSSDRPSVKKMAVRKKVAIKRLRVHMQTDKDFAKLLAKELHVWSKLDHANILPLVGYVLEGDYPSVVSEWIENGTVGKYLKENPDIDPVPLIIGIANGVDYLHRQNIVHSDLKADNVLVSPFGEPLICDFGISRMLASSLSFGSSTGGLKGSVRWMAFELLDITEDSRHTKETDVWAFGMTVYEIVTKELPYARLKHDVLVMFAILQDELPSLPGDFDDWSPDIQLIWKICEECWVSPPERRITMEQVVNSLHRFGKADISPESLQLPRDNSPTLTSMTCPSVPPLTPDYSSSSSDGCSNGRMSCSPDFRDARSRPVTPLSPIGEDKELNCHKSNPMKFREYSGYDQQIEISGNIPGKSNRLSPDELSLHRVIYPCIDKAPIIDKLLQQASPDLVGFDLRFPVTSVKKLVFGMHWTHLSYHDLSRAACQPPCDSMILTTRAPSDWTIDVQCVPSGSRTYVSVKDVLGAVHRLFRLAIPQEKEDKDSVLDLVQYQFGGLHLAHGGEGSQLWEVDIIHVNPFCESIRRSDYVF